MEAQIMTASKPRQPQLPRRNRMVQAETVCKVLAEIKKGKRTVVEIAARTGISSRTARRYIETISLYFPVAEDSVEHGNMWQSAKYWLEAD